jgi:hypothetical protein
MLSYR